MGTILHDRTSPLSRDFRLQEHQTWPDRNELGKHPNSAGSPRCTKYFRASHVRVICTCIPCPLRSPKPLTSELSARRARHSSSPALTHRRNASLQHHMHGPERCRLSKPIPADPKNPGSYPPACFSAGVQWEARPVSVALPVNAPGLCIPNFPCYSRFLTAACGGRVCSEARADLNKQINNKIK